MLAKVAQMLEGGIEGREAGEGAFEMIRQVNPPVWTVYDAAQGPTDTQFVRLVLQDLQHLLKIDTSVCIGNDHSADASGIERLVEDRAAVQSTNDVQADHCAYALLAPTAVVSTIGVLPAHAEVF
jgi:hypothetical protein